MMFDSGPPPKMWMPPRPAIIRPANEIVQANFLPGWFPIVGGAAASLTVTQVGSANSQASTVTTPASVDSGDLLVLCDSALAIFSTPTAVTPTGYTNVLNDSASLGSIGARFMLSYRIADGSEDSATVTGMNDQQETKVLIQFRGSYSISAASFLDIDSEITADNPTSQAIASSGGTPPLIVFGLYASAGAINPRTFSPTKDGEVGTTSSFGFVAWKIYNETPADASVDMDDESDANMLGSCYCELS